MKKLVLIIIAQEVGPRMNASSANQSEVRKGGLPSGGMFQEVLLARISIAETKDRGKS